MRKAMILAWALVASPVVAQTAAAQTANAPAPPSAAAPLDPAHLALARTTIDFVWPLGTYERMMKGTMDKMMDAMFQSMFDMKLTDIVPQTGKNAPDPKAANLTMREMMEKTDPHFQERLRITTRVMMDEMITMMNRVEPDIRAGLARDYARKFSDEQLADMNRFFATPSGRVYASEAMLTMMDPEVMSTMMKFAPEFIREMPGIMAKVQAATASLPPPPKHSVDIKR